MWRTCVRFTKTLNHVARIHTHSHTHTNINNNYANTRVHKHHCVHALSRFGGFCVINGDLRRRQCVSQQSRERLQSAGEFWLTTERALQRNCPAAHHKYYYIYTGSTWMHIRKKKNKQNLRRCCWYNKSDWVRLCVCVGNSSNAPLETAMRSESDSRRAPERAGFCRASTGTKPLSNRSLRPIPSD